MLEPVRFDWTTAIDWANALGLLMALSFVLAPVAAIRTGEGRRAWRNVSGAFIALRVAYCQFGLILAIMEPAPSDIAETLIAVQGITLA